MSVHDVTYELTAGSHTIGRSLTCDLTIREATLSRKHARIWRIDQDQITVEDLKSKNGTFVDDMRIQRQPLRTKSILRLGDIRFALYGSEPKVDSENTEETKSVREEKIRPVTRLPVENLSKTQRRVYELIVAGGDELAIAEQLKRSFHTIHQHVQAIFRKLGVHSRAELLAAVIRSEREVRA